MKSTQPVKCDRCGTEFQLPVLPDEEMRSEIVDLFHTGRKLLVIREVKQHYPISLRDGKAFIMHFQSSPGVCHQCGRALQVETYGTCPHCRSLNINW